ncbi:bifunctional demethylmenaquinone methyltransferase/2-methoxy-6-polyprenyl-1,4-benzoquinol methylase UbiE [Thermosipho atlanticus]|uniref:Demethylmenaquinone methyltransferase n=1 Tax=Thermosipho atlanticus DSM 15807 TaxID=1123380 RepID=A0A1M5SLT8_9BACT|nr:bifunctional demethylmenaquinone methyltransferase/2-methoxy-6-polyprenyl-1,4-benzoquinol methylase UbiE [Thermosipho atlanticus]SHH38853.1 demethylmenaquinone methyltransferase / 2-methoxy-6-polyprenyl-1,4-benzoquinol methylase [Thermosipho atlanticus DSM 15807]
MNNKKRLVHELFQNISSKYDKVNSIMSFGMDNLWRKKAIKLVKISKNDVCLDLCCGTGKFTELISEILGDKGFIYALDISENMLEIAKNRINKQNIKFILGDATETPFENNFFDVVTMGWGLRNIPDIHMVLTEIYRILKVGGRFVLLDMGKPNTFLIKNFYWFYLKKIVPLIGKIVTGNKDPYIYFYKSIENFPSSTEIKDLLSKIGFKNTKSVNLALGAVSIIYGEKY